MLRHHKQLFVRDINEQEQPSESRWLLLLILYDSIR